MRLWSFLVIAGAVVLAWPIWATDGVVASQMAAPSCADDSRVSLRFGLTPDECDCGLSDGSPLGEWRLASADEWYAILP